MIPTFFVTYLLLAGLVLGLISSFFVAVSVRNRLVSACASLFNVICNPLATAAAETRSFAATIRDAVPETAFAPGVVHRVLFLATFLLLAAVDVALSGERMAAFFGTAESALPVDVSWASGIGWVVSAGLFFAVSLCLRHEVVGHPFDQLDAGARKLLRLISDVFVVTVLVSAAVFYVAGSLLVAGSVPLGLVVVFMALLGVCLVAASGIAFWAATDAWTTASGIVLVVVSLLVRFIAFLPEMVVIALRNLANLVMTAIDVPFMGVAYPMLRWWAGSKLGKALGFPPLELPIAHPPVGCVEPPAERSLVASDAPEQLGPLEDTRFDSQEEAA